MQRSSDTARSYPSPKPGDLRFGMVISAPAVLTYLTTASENASHSTRMASQWLESLRIGPIEPPSATPAAQWSAVCQTLAEALPLLPSSASASALAAFATAFALALRVLRWPSRAHAPNVKISGLFRCRCNLCLPDIAQVRKQTCCWATGNWLPTATYSDLQRPPQKEECLSYLLQLPSSMACARKKLGGR